jgi:hypothetical protein
MLLTLVGKPIDIEYAKKLEELGMAEIHWYEGEWDYLGHIKNKIELVLNNKDLQKDMIEKGLKRAKLFSWEKI